MNPETLLSIHRYEKNVEYYLELIVKWIKVFAVGVSLNRII